MAAFWLRISVYVWIIELSAMPVGSNACRSSAWVRTIPSRAFSWYTHDSSYLSMKSRASRGLSRIRCRASSVRSSRSRYRVRLTRRLLLQLTETLTSSSGKQAIGPCQSTALLCGNHGSLRHSRDPDVGRTATVRGCRARIRNLRGSRGIPPRRLRQAPAFCGRLGRREPLHVARLQAADGAEERSLDLLRQRAHFTDADPTIVYFTHRRDLRRGAAQESLVGAVQIVAREAALFDRDPLVLGDPQDGLAGDPFENATRDRRRVERSVPHQEEVLAGRLGDIALLVEQDRLVVAGDQRLALGEN